MASHKILSSNDIRKHYFAIGKEEVKKLNLEKTVTILCSGRIFPNRKVDKSKGQGHIYARKEFFDINHLDAGDHIDFEVDSSTNTIKVIITYKK